MLAGLKQSVGQVRLRVNGLTVRAISDKSSDGAVKEEGGSFGKKGEADENAYFYKLAQEQLENLKKEENSADNKEKVAGKQMEREKDKSEK